MNRSSVPFPCSRRAKTAVFLLLAVGMTTGFVVRVGAQQGPKPKAAAPNPVLSVPERFAADLETLARRMKVTFVVEGQPIGAHADVMPDTLQAALSKEGVAEDKTARELAEFYDYSAARRGNVFVLTKLYTDPTEMPDVTPEECRLAVRAASQILAPFKPDIPPLPPLPIENRGADPLSTLIAGRLTPQQFADLSQDGLVVGTLAGPQRDAVWQMALQCYMESQVLAVQSAADFLDALAAQDPLFHWQPVADVVPFGHDFNSPTTLKMVFVTISNRNRVVVAPDGMMITITSHSTKNGVPVEDFDPTDPIVNKAAKKPAQDVPAAPTLAITLAAAVAALNGQGSPQLSYQVDAALAAKRLMIVGKGEADATKLMDAFAEVYGLRVRHANNDALILTRPRNLAAPDITKLDKALRDVTPAPLLRVLHARMRTQYKPHILPNEVVPPIFVEGDYEQAARDLQLAVTRQLRALAEPKVRAAKNSQLKLSKLGEQEQKLFALSHAANAFGQLCSFVQRPVPGYISDFDHVRLTGGPYQNEAGEPRFALSLWFINPSTREMYPGVGFTNGRLPH